MVGRTHRTGRRASPGEAAIGYRTRQTVALRGCTVPRSGVALDRRALRRVPRLQHDDDLVGLWRESLRPARFPATEGEVRALRLADAAAGLGPRRTVPKRAAGRGRALGEKHRRFLE